MSKNKKYHTGIPVTKASASRAQQERCYLIAKKMLRHLELEPELIDIFTKKQRQELLTIWFDAPIVKPKIEKTIPRQYVRNIHTDMHHYMKTNFLGDPENQLIYMDAVIYGLSFITNVFNIHERGGLLFDDVQQKALERIYQAFDINKIIGNIFEKVLEQVWFQTRGYSKINFRMYGYEFNLENVKRTGGNAIKAIILLTAQDSETKRFTYNGIMRKAYRVLNTADGLYEAISSIRKNWIFPSAKPDERLNVYVQSHVLHRMKERLDIYSPALHNISVLYAFTAGLRTANVDGKVLFACLTEDILPVGYFTFFVQGEDVVVNTFLPITSDNTPEGKKLHELLPLSKEEKIYLGMDKLSFLMKVDFEQIPILKQALIDSGIWLVKQKLDAICERSDSIDGEPEIDVTKTLFVKRFFEKLEETRH